MSLTRRPTGLPSNPRARTFTAAGSPKHVDIGPRSRSFTAAQVTQDIIPRPQSSASERPPPSSFRGPAPPLPEQARTLRPMRSMGNLPQGSSGSARSRSLDRRAEPRPGSSRSNPPPPPVPSLPEGPRLGRVPTRRDVPAHVSSRSMDYDAYRARERAEEVVSDSASSSGMSDGFARSPESAASSRTSMDEADMNDKMDDKTPAGFGSSLWSNITGVASNLTINVSKAWSSKLPIYGGEETPVGGESRLTRAMKAYYIDQARDPADLPEWLFDERERGVRSHRDNAAASVTDTKKAERDPRSDDLSRPVTTRSTRHREEELAAAAAVPPPRIARGPTLADRKADDRGLSGAGSEAHVTKSMARLRELRDAKRNAKVRFGDEGEGEDAASPGAPPQAFANKPVAVAEREREQYTIPIPTSMPPPTRPRGMGMAAPLGANLGVRGRQPSTRVGLPSGVRPVRA